MGQLPVCIMEIGALLRRHDFIAVLAVLAPGPVDLVHSNSKKPRRWCTTDRAPLVVFPSPLVSSRYAQPYDIGWREHLHSRRRDRRPTCHGSEGQLLVSDGRAGRMPYHHTADQHL
jgi:hypothetical protein